MYPSGDTMTPEPRLWAFRARGRLPWPRSSPKNRRRKGLLSIGLARSRTVVVVAIFTTLGTTFLMTGAKLVRAFTCGSSGWSWMVRRGGGFVFGPGAPKTVNARRGEEKAN